VTPLPVAGARKYQSHERPVARPDNTRKSHVRDEIFPKDNCDLLNEAIAQVKRRTTVVRIAVAKFESTPVTPIFARIAVALAKSAESNDQVSQLFIAMESQTRGGSLSVSVHHDDLTRDAAHDDR